ncbi:MAG: hypothetical protein AAF750_03390 [Planctomycetota bacterium]
MPTPTPKPRHPTPDWLTVTASAIAVVLLLASPGCRTKGQGPTPGQSQGPVRPNPADVAAQAWYPIPDRLQVFPTTRFVIERGRPVLEARVEVLDTMGHPLKTSGQFRFELFAAPPGADRATEKLYTWNQALQTADDQREHFDPVTFAYRFQLQLRDQALQNRPTVLRVTLAPPMGPRLTTSHAVRTDW